MSQDRWSSLFETLFLHVRDLDVVAMQEVTEMSWNLLLRTDKVRADWIVADCNVPTSPILDFNAI